MTITDDQQNPKPPKNRGEPLDAITALRHAMEQRLQEERTRKKPKTEKAEAATPEPQAAAPEPASAYDPAAWSKTYARIAQRSQKLIIDYMERNRNTTNLMPLLPASFAQAYVELAERLLADPTRFVDAQIALWQGYAKIWQTALTKMQGGHVPDAVPAPASDKRFQDKEWQENWLFDYLKQMYLLTAQHTRKLIRDEAAKLNPKLAQKLDFLTRQAIDAAAPSNFWMTNPEVLRAIYASGGESLVKGLDNLLTDLERGKGELLIRLTDAAAFHLGQNIAATPGKVIYQNELMQLIRYAPQTENVYAVPLLITPPWINKFYILDLREKNSFINYLVRQGHSVFCISWVNPDAHHAAVDFDDYMESGILAAMREAAKATGANNINLLGYCIGGTLLASTLAYLKAAPRDDMPHINSATYLTTLVDFAEPGELGVFIDEDTIKLAEERMAQQGYMDAATMATVFSLLRSNDLIWSYVINNYLLGKDPTPFDILYWNSDSTNLPAAMHSFYLRNMYLENKLVKPNGLTMKGAPIDLTRIDTPSYILATKDDHIAPWKSAYAATRLYHGPVTFALGGSGHIAGVINHPDAGKYGYWTNAPRSSGDVPPCSEAPPETMGKRNSGITPELRELNNLPPSADDWFAAATLQKGSWWTHWLAWLETYAGERVPALPVSGGIEDAPGHYVKVRAV